MQAVYINIMGSFWKIIKYPLIVLIVVVSINAVAEKVYLPVRMQSGVSFSPAYARYLKLDWQKTYLQILDDLKVKNLRITGYWDIVQPKPDQYNFTELDYMLSEAGKRGVRVIPVLGVKQPRWPECHIPVWARSLTVADRQQKILEFVQRVVKRYRNYSAIEGWQVENEPFLSFFGQGCDAPDKNFLKKEVELVKGLSNKPIIMTDSGELGSWVPSMQLSDIFGATLYRRVYDKNLGYFTFPLPAYFYSIKSNITRIFAPENKKTIIAELQAEPWLQQFFTVQDFKANVEFARKTGFDTSYLWGVEWWFFMAAQGHPEYLDYAKTLFVDKQAD